MKKTSNSIVNGFLIILTGLALIPMLVGCNQEEEANPPNVIMFITDDLNNWVNPLGYNQAITPNLDRLAEAGVTFTMPMPRVYSVLPPGLQYGPVYTLQQQDVTATRYFIMTIRTCCGGRLNGL